ncbi:hypothetical protein KW805_00410 [Candidatus Pacearchaeota archaeon]|nr:hypothetical protein [Candidatus Pacearchaeota archaeon]
MKKVKIIREIPSKIKEVKEVPRESKSLEEEVHESETETFASTISTTPPPSLVLKNERTEERNEEPEAPRQQQQGPQLTGSQLYEVGRTLGGNVRSDYAETTRPGTRPLVVNEPSRDSPEHQTVSPTAPLTESFTQRVEPERIEKRYDERDTRPGRRKYPWEA